jgi:hypothetical protein
MPQHEVDIKELTSGGTDIMKRGQEHALAKWQSRSAVGHWAVMRTVMPARVWENW